MVWSYLATTVGCACEHSRARPRPRHRSHPRRTTESPGSAPATRRSSGRRGARPRAVTPSGVGWAARLPVRQVRIARPTDQLDEVVRFYRDGLGLTEIDRFEEHDGFSGVMLGLPGSDYHLEFTSHVDGSPGDAPSGDNLL